MTRVVFGVTASPFLLQATIRKHLQQYEESDPDLVAVLRRDLYCDDLITSVHSAHEGEELKRRSVEIFSHARMNLRHWTTSRSEAEVEPEGPDHLKRPGEHTDNTKKVLGVSRVPESDQLIFMTEPLASLGAQLAETKRNILRIAARFFDPLGLLAPFSVRAQMMLKELWKNGVGWDQPIPQSVARKWAGWLRELRHLDRVTVPSSYGLSVSLRYQLHVFCDASQHAYAAVVYTRTENETGDQKTAVVMCKSRLSPSQNLTLPRLELTSCLIGARLATYSRQHLKPSTSSLGNNSAVRKVMTVQDMLTSPFSSWLFK